MEEQIRRLLAEIDAKSKELNELLESYQLTLIQSVDFEEDDSELDEKVSDENEYIVDIQIGLDELESGITSYQEFKGWI